MTGARIALLGAGLIGREHAALVAAHPAASLVAIVDPATEAVGLAASLGAQHYDDYEQMLDEVVPDGVIVALPNTLHVDAGLACIARGIPVLVEKPIADTVASAMRLVEAGEEADIPVLVGHHRRHGSDIREAKRAIESGELGRIVAINGIAAVAKHDTYFDADWRRLPGGGPLLINAIHDIDCFRTLCGEIESVQAIGSSAVRGHAVEDTVAVALQFRERRARHLPADRRLALAVLLGDRCGAVADLPASGRRLLRRVRPQGVARGAHPRSVGARGGG